MQTHTPKKKSQRFEQINFKGKAAKLVFTHP